MIKRVLSIAISASLLSSCAVLTVQDVGGGNFYVQGIMLMVQSQEQRVL